MKYDDENVEKEIQKNPNEVEWNIISQYQILSESFIEKYKDKLDWYYISKYQKLSESFIERHLDKVLWPIISEYQTLSESFIEKYQDKVNWTNISQYQILSESFMEKHEYKVRWFYISMFQDLSESFIEKHKDEVDWIKISIFQTLSESFIEKYKYKVDYKCQILSESFIEKYKYKLDYKTAKKVNKQPSIRRRIARAKKYARINNLEIKDGYLYAYRDHDKSGKGKFHSRIRYDKKNYEYRDWHCDPRKNEENSYGLGIFPEGNTKVRVKLEDFVISVCHKSKKNYKGRVWAFEIIE